METTENEAVVQPTPPPEPVLVITAEAQYYLRETAKWANFLAIVGFILCALFLIMALCMSAVFAVLGRLAPVYNQLPSGLFTVFSVLFILLDVLYFFFPYYLYQFAGKAKKGLFMANSQVMTEAFSKLKSFFKLCGIVTIVMLCIYALEIIGIISAISMLPH